MATPTHGSPLQFMTDIDQNTPEGRTLRAAINALVRAEEREGHRFRDIPAVGCFRALSREDQVLGLLTMGAFYGVA